MKKIEDFEVMESFGMSNVTIDEMFDIDGACWLYDVPGGPVQPGPRPGPGSGCGQ